MTYHVSRGVKEKIASLSNWFELARILTKAWWEVGQAHSWTGGALTPLLQNEWRGEGVVNDGPAQNEICCL